MRIIRKEKVDVKKFMEDMKANRTNRSYHSIDHRRSLEQTSSIRPVPIDNHSKTSTVQDFQFQRPSHGSFKSYPNMSQMSQNSQNYMPNQLGPQFSHPQSFYSYQPQYGSNPYPFPNSVPYTSNPYPQHIQFTQVSQVESSLPAKADPKRRKTSESSFQSREQVRENEIKQSNDMPEMVTEKKNARKKCKNQDPKGKQKKQEESREEKIQKVKKKLDKKIQDQKKDMKTCDFLMEDLRLRLKQSLGNESFEERMEKLCTLTAELSNLSNFSLSLELNSLEADWTIIQTLK